MINKGSVFFVVRLYTSSPERLVLRGVSGCSVKEEAKLAVKR